MKLVVSIVIFSLCSFSALAKMMSKRVVQSQPAVWLVTVLRARFQSLCILIWLGKMLCI